MRNGDFSGAIRLKDGGCPARLAVRDFSISTFRSQNYADGMAANLFHHERRVTYADCTVGNHIYYARYLDWLEAARGEFFRKLGGTFWNWQERDTIFPVVEARLRYQSPARYDDLLVTEVWLTTAQRIRLNFSYRIVNQSGTIILEAETLHVCTGLNEKPKRLPEELVAAVKPYLHGEREG